MNQTSFFIKNFSQVPSTCSYRAVRKGDGYPSDGFICYPSGVSTISAWPKQIQRNNGGNSGGKKNIRRQKKVTTTTVGSIEKVPEHTSFRMEEDGMITVSVEGSVGVSGMQKLVGKQQLKETEWLSDSSSSSDDDDVDDIDHDSKQQQAETSSATRFRIQRVEINSLVGWTFARVEGSGQIFFRSPDGRQVRSVDQLLNGNRWDIIQRGSKYIIFPVTDGLATLSRCGNSCKFGTFVDSIDDLSYEQKRKIKIMTRQDIKKTTLNIDLF